MTCDPSQWNPPYTPVPGNCSGGDPTNCLAPKELDLNIPPLNPLVTFNVDRFTFTWDISTLYPDQRVALVYRRYEYNGWWYESPLFGLRDGGSIDTTVVELDFLYKLWIRPETPTHFGPWEKFIGLAEDGWDSNSELVTHEAIFVKHVDKFVYFRTP